MFLQDILAVGTLDVKNIHASDQTNTLPGDLPLGRKRGSVPGYV